MTGRENKKAKGRRNLYSHSKGSSSSGHKSGGSVTSSLGAAGGMPPISPFQPFGNGITMNVCDVTTEFGSLKSVLPTSDQYVDLGKKMDEWNSKKSSVTDTTVTTDISTITEVSEEAVNEKITELMDAPVDIDIPTHAISRGQNPYLDHCMYCSTPRTDSQDGDEGLELLDLQLDGSTVINSMANPQSFSSLKLEIWTCAKCRKVAGNFQSFLEANLPQSSYDVPSFLHEKGPCMDAVSCERCIEERDIHDRETLELQENWVELRSIVKDLYCSTEEPVLTDDQGDRLKFLVDKLCSRDPHQLFLRLESQVRDLVTGIKTSLLEKLTSEGHSTPEQALGFTSSMLSHYDLLTKKAHLLAQYLGGLSDHLRRFKVTWELLNKHLFQFIVYVDPAINNCGPTILEQLRQGSLKYEKSKEDPFCVVRKRLLKFQEQMSVVVVVWRDCQQLIENYCQEEVKNTQKQVQILKDHLIKEPLMDEALSETMRNLMSGHKSSTEKVMCHRCKRERCTCDECTITHMITCGIINSDKGEIPPPPNSFNFALDHTRNVVMDITPPSMSSTTSSSGSVSPINIDDRLTTFYDCKKALNEEYSDALLNCAVPEEQSLRFNGEGVTDDVDDNAGDDEEEDDEGGEEDDGGGEDFLPDCQDAGGDEPHTLQAFALHCDDTPPRHSYAHKFQPPQLDPDLSRQLDAELAKTGLLPGGLSVDESPIGDSRGAGGDGGASPSVFAACQCHACLKQSGHMISTSLPVQIEASPPPAQLHLYSHIYGDGLAQQQQRFMFDLPAPVMPSVKISGMQDHIYSAYSDWDNTLQPRPGSLAAQHHNQHHQRLSALTSDLLPPAPLATAAPPFSFDSLTLASHLATHTTQTSTTSTASAFKSMAGKQLASSILPTLGQFTAEGSSVDPTKPLDFAALAQKLPQSCLNLASPTSLPFSIPSSFSAPSSVITSSATSTITSKSSNSSHGPPCSRPPPLGGNAASSKWERGSQHPSHCKKVNSGGFLNKPGNVLGLPGPLSPHNPAVNPFSATTPHNAPSPQPPTAAGLKNIGGGCAGGGHRPEDVFKNIRSTLPCAHASNPALRPPTSACSAAVPHSGSLTAPSALPHQASPNIPLACSNANSQHINNIGVGTALPCSGEAGFEGHHNHLMEDNCDSVDDSCSEKSSSTSTSNQKEGKYCDCCYCEFFGHNNAQVAKTSTNYAEMKDRLRKKLKKRNETKHKGGRNDGGNNGCTAGVSASPKNALMEPCNENEPKDPLEKKGLEGLLSFINGTDDGQEQSKKDKAKAAKRARQKQKKLEEKARKEKSNSPCEKKREAEPCQRHPLHNQTLNFDPKAEFDFSNKANMVKAKSLQLPNSLAEVAKKDLRENTAPSQSKSQEIPRSSLIIESTRATISRTPKDLEKTISSQQTHQTNHSSKTKTNTIVNTIAANVPEPVKIDSLPSAAPNKQLRVVLQPKTPKRQAAQQQQQQQQLQQQQQQLQQQQQQQMSVVNGKLPNGKPVMNGHVIVSAAPATQSNNVTSNGRQAIPSSIAPNKSSTTPLNGVKKSMATQPPQTQSAPSVKNAPSSNTKSSNVNDSPGAGSSSSASQSPSSGSTSDVGKPSGKAKKNKKKNKNDLSCVDEIFMPKPANELDGITDEFDRELEEFKRFCLDTQQPTQRRKIAVNVNLKDIFKKKTGLV